MISKIKQVVTKKWVYHTAIVSNCRKNGRNKERSIVHKYSQRCYSNGVHLSRS